MDKEGENSSAHALDREVPVRGGAEVGEPRAQRGCLRYREIRESRWGGWGTIFSPAHSGFMLLWSQNTHLPEHLQTLWPVPSLPSPVTSAQRPPFSFPQAMPFPIALSLQICKTHSVTSCPTSPCWSPCPSAVQKAQVWRPPTASSSWLQRPSEINWSPPARPASTCLPCLHLPALPPPARPTCQVCTLVSGSLIKENSQRAHTCQHSPSFLKEHPGATT